MVAGGQTWTEVNVCNSVVATRPDPGCTEH
jgi:hypothetical protein